MNLKRYGGVITGLICLIVLTSGCVSMEDLTSGYLSGDNLSNSTRKITAYGVSFEYPSGWFANADNTTGDNTITASKDFGFNNVQFQVTVWNNDGMPEDSAVNLLRENDSPGWKKISSNELTIDNKTAYEDVYLVNDSHFSKLMRISSIILVKNDKSYMMFLQAPDDEFDSERANFDIILNSFQVL
ncbi:PsbP-related protein [Methanobacterium movens]